MRKGLLINFNKPRWHLFGALSLVVFVGLLHLPYPFDGDQALFTLGAMDISEGYTLYGDFWDMKQPGIYLFYFAGGSLFGFTEVGIHLFELLYWLAFCISAWLMLRRTLHPLLAIWMPALAVAAYYLASGPWHLTQAEMIVSFPLFVAAMSAYKAISDGRLRLDYLLLSGFASGLVLLFKLILAPILLGFWGLTLFSAVRAGEKPGRIVSGIAMAGLVSLMPLAIALGLGALSGVGTTMLWTFFVLPTQVIAEGESATLNRLFVSMRWFVDSFAVMIGLAIVGVAHVKTSLKPFVLHMLTWLGMAFIVILLQRNSWWEYHMLLLLVPTVFLTGLGLSSLEVSILKNLKPWLRGGLLLLAFFAFLGPLTFAALTCTAKMARLFASRSTLDYQASINSTYAAVAKDVAQFRSPPEKREGVIVFGNPLYLYLSGRRQAIPINGWSLEFLTAGQWNSLASSVKKSSASLFFLAEEYRELVQAKAPAIVEHLKKDYEILSVSDHGTWFRRRK